MFLPARQLAKFPNSPEEGATFDRNSQISRPSHEQNTSTFCHLTALEIITAV
jgi:hypothetical protein